MKQLRDSSRSQVGYCGLHYLYQYIDLPKVAAGSLRDRMAQNMKHVTRSIFRIYGKVRYEGKIDDHLSSSRVLNGLHHGTLRYFKYTNAAQQFVILIAAVMLCFADFDGSFLVYWNLIPRENLEHLFIFMCDLRFTIPVLRTAAASQRSHVILKLLSRFRAVGRSLAVMPPPPLS